MVFAQKLTAPRFVKASPFATTVRGYGEMAQKVIEGRQQHMTA